MVRHTRLGPPLKLLSYACPHLFALMLIIFILSQVDGISLSSVICSKKWGFQRALEVEEQTWGQSSQPVILPLSPGGWECHKGNCVSWWLLLCCSSLGV